TRSEKKRDRAGQHARHERDRERALDRRAVPLALPAGARWGLFGALCPRSRSRPSLRGIPRAGRLALKRAHARVVATVGPDA
ncbi:MAG: hypothetical protein GWO21_01820, partial [Gammaproteobacteria bacterium]|nr:hypothetical protein [Gammaproteobacteria bacterium]